MSEISIKEKPEGTYKCNVCNTHFLSKDAIEEHYKRAHRDTKSAKEYVQESKSKTENSKREEMTEGQPDYRNKR